MDLEELRTLLALLKEHDVHSYRYEDDTRHLELQFGGEPAAPVAVAHASMPSLAPSVLPVVPAPSVAPPASSAPPPAAAQGVEVKAPVVGTFYISPSPGADPFVEVGQRVDKGDVLCIIEAMKLMNEIEAEVSGTVVARLVDDAQPVEYGQAIFRIRPD